MTFPPLAQDIWSSMFKFSPEFRKPEELAPSHRFNSTLLEKMVQMQEYRELRVHTRLDEMHSIGHRLRTTIVSTHIVFEINSTFYKSSSFI
jgi:hypothetical protein